LEGIKIAVGTEIGVLHHVLGIRRVAGQPAGQIVGCVEMRQGQQLEAAASVVLGQGVLAAIAATHTAGRWSLFPLSRARQGAVSNAPSIMRGDAETRRTIEHSHPGIAIGVIFPSISTCGYHFSQ
jgi:hypothetical protein